VSELSLCARVCACVCVRVRVRVRVSVFRCVGVPIGYTCVSVPACVCVPGYVDVYGGRHPTEVLLEYQRLGIYICIHVRERERVCVCVFITHKHTHTHTHTHTRKTQVLWCKCRCMYACTYASSLYIRTCVCMHASMHVHRNARHPAGKSN